MMPRLATLLIVLISLLPAMPQKPRRIEVDMRGYLRSGTIEVRGSGEHLIARWPSRTTENITLELSLNPSRPLISRITHGSTVIAQNLNPYFRMTVGTRQAPPGRPPEMSIWNTFFDKPASRPHQTYSSKLSLTKAKVTLAQGRGTISLNSISLGPFSGRIDLTIFSGSPLIQMEAVVTTEEDRVAYIYDAGLVASAVEDFKVVWRDARGEILTDNAALHSGFQSLAILNRVMAAEGAKGSLAVFPPPHQYQFPRDWTDNFRFGWIGNAAESGLGFGARQDPEGGGAFVPWINAPPGTAQRLGLFLLASPGSGEKALNEALRYTRGDRFDKIPGYVTFTSHYHMAIAVAAMERVRRGESPVIPDFVKVFKEMGVDSVHLGEFHGDGHQRDHGPLRLPEMRAMFDECRRLSDSELLLIPGEELNDFLGVKQPGKHPGHWMSLFPKPIYFTQTRNPEQPLVEEIAPYGKVYRISSTADMVELMKRENGLAWTAHPRIKASSWTPDIFRNEEFYQAGFWLGAAWKAMPADLSREKLGERALDLLDDMSNWGPRKYLPGEVDVFKIDCTHELYGHMNVNYLKLPRIPRFDEGWQPILDTLRAGRFFVTTGEVLIPEFTVGGKESGEEARIPSDGRPEIKAKLQFTFPLKFAEVISGDGQKVYRERIELSMTREFGAHTLQLRQDLRARKWVRLEVWDIAANGAFTQPVWLVSK